MEADVILQAAENYLAPLVEAEGGKLEVCGTPEDTLELMATGPANFRVILQWGGEDSAGKGGSEALMDLKVVVQSAKGMKLKKGDDVYKARSGDRQPFLRLCAKLRGWIRAIKFKTTANAPHPAIHCDGFVPQSTKWMAGGLDELAPVREAVLSLQIRFAVDPVDDVTVQLPA